MNDTGAVAAIGALADPIRMQLFRFISEHDDAVSREEAAEALGLPLTKAKFHLERLTAEGLLATEYRRRSGKQGPGAGRPAKLYRRSTTEFRLSLPERRYDIMGTILASAVAKTRTGVHLDQAIDCSAYETGRATGATLAAAASGGPERNEHASHENSHEKAQERPVQGRSSATEVYEHQIQREELSSRADLAGPANLARAKDTLDVLGYETQIESEEMGPGGTGTRGPAPEDPGAGPSEHPSEHPVDTGTVLKLKNCPFDALAQDHRALVCGANVHYVQGVLDGSDNKKLAATLEPCPGYCCVAVRPETSLGSVEEQAG